MFLYHRKCNWNKVLRQTKKYRKCIVIVLHAVSNFFGGCKLLVWILNISFVFFVGVFWRPLQRPFILFYLTFEVYASNMLCNNSVRVTMHLLSCQGFWEWWVNLLVKHEYTLLEKSGFHSPVQYLKMMEGKALPVITTSIKRSDFQVIFCKCYVKLPVFWYFAWPTFSNKKHLFVAGLALMPNASVPWAKVMNAILK